MKTALLPQTASFLQLTVTQRQSKHRWTTPHRQALYARVRTAIRVFYGGVRVSAHSVCFGFASSTQLRFSVSHSLFSRRRMWSLLEEW